MLEFKKFSSIELFKNVIKEIKDNYDFHKKPYPVLAFTGTVKLHGTNFGIGYNTETKEMITQSKENIITPESDNNHSSAWAYQSKELKEELERLAQLLPTAKNIYVYGEWAGAGIQKKVGLKELKQKSFFIFRVIADEERIGLSKLVYYNKEVNESRRLFYINEFPTYKIEIDFNRPELSQNKLVEITLAVEEKCPVMSKFGYSGIGEGVVWENEEKELSFKVKGPKHSSTKVKTIKEIAAVDIEKINKLVDFVDRAASENRLAQGLDKLVEQQLDPHEITNLGAYIKWVVTDILKEEADTIKLSGFENKMLGHHISKKARNYFSEKSDEYFNINTNESKKLKNF